VAVDARAAMTGHMLDDRQDTAFEQPGAYGAAEPGNALRVAPIGPIPDHPVRSARWKIQDGQAIDCDSQKRQVIGNEPCTKPGCRLCLGVGQRRDPRGRWIGAPLRRAKSRYSAAFLVDQNWGVGPAHRSAKCTDEVADLLGRSTVSPEEDEADWIPPGEEVALERGQALARTPENDRKWRLSGQSGTRHYAASARCKSDLRPRPGQ
jgi:hypothetical protein